MPFGFALLRLLGIAEVAADRAPGKADKNGRVSSVATFALNTGEHFADFYRCSIARAHNYSTYTAVLFAVSSTSTRTTLTVG